MRNDQLQLAPSLSFIPDRRLVECDWQIGTDRIRVFGPPAPLDYVFNAVGSCPVSLSVTDDQGATSTFLPLDVEVLPRSSLPSPDLDGDGDVDLDDFGQIQRCYPGSGMQQLDPDCAAADVTGDGSIDEQDIARFKLCATSADVQAAPECLPAGPAGESFTRPSVAYSGDAVSMHDYAANERRYEVILTANDSDGATLTGEADGYDLYPLGSNSRYLFAYSATRRFYRSADGFSWTALPAVAADSDPPYSLVVIPSGPHQDRIIRFRSTRLAAGYLLSAVYDGSQSSTIQATSSMFNQSMRGYSLVFSNKAWCTILEVISTQQVRVSGDVSAQGVGQSITVQNMTPLYSDNDGDNWCEAMGSDGTPFSLGCVASGVRDWNWQYANGTLIVADYGATPQRIMRSADEGTTWSTVFTRVDPITFMHFHAVGFHPQIGSNGRWIANTGDGPGLRHDFISDDNGLTWQDCLPGREAPDAQTVRYFYDGDPTRLLVGSDYAGGIGWLDLTNWTWGGFGGLNWTSGSQYSSVFFKFGDLYYAAQTLGNTGDTIVLSVSPDLTHWTVYHRLTDSSATGFKAFCGYKGGKLHFSYYINSGEIKHFAITPANVHFKTGLRLEPATSNLLPEALSGFETVAGMTIKADPGGYDLDPVRKHAGTYSLHIRKTGIAQCLIPITNNSAQPKKLRARVRARGTGRVFQLFWSQAAGYPASPDEWREYVSPVRSFAPYETYSLNFAAYPETATNLSEVWLDSLQVEENPGSPSWNPGARSREAEALERRITLEPQWTHVFSIRTDVDSKWIQNRSLLVSYSPMFDLGTTLNVWFYPSSQKLSLELTVNGQVQSTITSQATWFYPDSRLRIAVRRSTDGYRLSLINGGSPEHVSTVLPGTPVFGSVVVRMGPTGSDPALPCTLYESTFYPTALPNAGIFDQQTTP